MNKNIWIIILVSAALSVGIWFYLKKKNEKDAKEKAQKDALSITPIATTNGGLAPAPPMVILPVGSAPLKMGSRGKMVQMVQVLLSQNPDGIWGNKTQAAFDKSGLKAIDTVWTFIKYIAPDAGANKFPLVVGQNNSMPYVKVLQIIANQKIDGIFSQSTAQALGKQSVSFNDYKNLLADLLNLG